MAPPTLAVIGLGYVGLPLSLQFARGGTRVLGLDIDAAKIEAINSGNTYIRHIPASAIVEVMDAGKFGVSTDLSRVREANWIVICVPTPLTRTREPDLSYVLNTGRAIAPHLQRGTLVVLESTTYPGTTDEDLRAVLEEGSGMKAGADFHLAYSPEREDPGNAESNVGKVPKIVGGYSAGCRDKAVELYSRAVETVIPVSSCKTAEATKLLENIFRSVNIALVNELKVIYAAMGIDIWEVIEAAKTKPFGFMAFYPGPGLGGHCIPIDPFYLAWKAREFGKHTRFIELAGEINTAMPDYVVSRLIEALNLRKKSVNGSKIMLVGLAYKADVDDTRESPTFVLMDKLRALGAELSYYDPHVPVIGPTREHADWQGVRSIDWDEATVRGFDAVIIVTAHSTVNYEQLAAWCPCIVDTRNVYATRPGKDSGRLNIFNA
jgi:UDP-N-acetyl-D-glucosamine dehydrogenase